MRQRAFRSFKGHFWNSYACNLCYFRPKWPNIAMRYFCAIFWYHFFICAIFSAPFRKHTHTMLTEFWQTKTSVVIFCKLIWTFFPPSSNVAHILTKSFHLIFKDRYNVKTHKNSNLALYMIFNCLFRQFSWEENKGTSGQEIYIYVISLYRAMFLCYIFLLYNGCPKKNLSESSLMSCKLTYLEQQLLVLSV